MKTAFRLLLLTVIWAFSSFAEQKNGNLINPADMKVKSYGSPVLANKDLADSYITILKDKSRASLSLMTNLLAEQTVRLWGEDKDEEVWRHEVAIYGGRQTYRKIDANGKLDKPKFTLPIPKPGTRPGEEWYSLFKNLTNAPVDYLGASSSNGKTTHFFSYKAGPQDKICYYTEHTGFLNNWEGSVGCSAEIVTDEQFNIIQIYQELYLPKGRLSSVIYDSVTYDFVNLCESQELLRLPVAINIATQFNYNQKWYFASGVWKNYRRFHAKSDIVYPRIDVNISYPR